MAGLLILLAVGLALAWAASVALLAWFLSHPPRRTYSAAVARGLAGDPSELDPPAPFETWSLRQSAHDIEVWDITGNDPAGPIVVLLHGWGDSRIGALVRLSQLRDTCSRAILFDLPGHGVSPGICRLGGTEHTLVTALLDEIVPADAAAGAPIVLYGWSLGGGLAIRVAADDPRVSGVLAEAPYALVRTPAERVLHLRRLPHRLSLRPALALLGTIFGLRWRWRGFDRRRHAARLSVPLLVLHGTDDPISPIEDGRAMAEAAERGSITEIRAASHNDLWTDSQFADTCKAAATDFLGSIAHRSA